MRRRKLDNVATFVKFDKVNGRSYKTIRARPAVGPTPSINNYIEAPKLNEDVAPIENNEIHQFDGYHEKTIAESLDADEISPVEEGLMQGYIKA